MSNQNKDKIEIETDSQFYYSVWRTINWSWEKAWTERSGDAPAWWIGRMAGLIFRFREIFGFADAYYHGSLTAGSGELSPRGRKFRDGEFEIRKSLQKRRKENPPKFSTSEEIREFIATHRLTTIKALLQEAKENGMPEVEVLKKIERTVFGGNS